MNKKYLMIFSLIFMIIFTCGCVSAMEQHNFGSDFTMNVPKDSNFEKAEGAVYDDLPFNEIDYVDQKNKIVVSYINDPMISDENVDCNYDSLFTLLNPKLDECIEYMEGNMKIIEPKKKSDNRVSVVGLHENNNTIILMGSNTDTLKDMAQTVEFK
jgi:hypothetical protein